MSVGILIISHDKVGEAVTEAALDMLNKKPLAIRNLSVMQDEDPMDLLKKARGLLEEVESGDGVLILTDMYGSTPSNIANRLKDNHIRVVAGFNLPMLVRILNYAYEALPALTEIALEGGRNGILECQIS